MKRHNRWIITRKVFFFVLFVTVCTALSGQDAAKQATPPARPVFRTPAAIRSAELLPDNRVIFRLYAPKAQSVSVSGEWMAGWGASEKMERNDTGLYTYTAGPLKPELYAYSFTVDGVRMTDPNNVQVRRDGTRYESFFIIPGTGSDLYIQKDNVAHGTVTKIWYNSSVLEMQRRMYVYTPAGYENGRRRYPVLYLFHGAGGDEDAWTTMGRAAQILDNLISEGKARPMIVVMTNGNAPQSCAQNDLPLAPVSGVEETASYFKYAGKFEEHLVKDVVPFIEMHYRTLTGMNNRAIAGLSMGGGQTLTIAGDNPGIFGYIGVFSMGITNYGPQTPDAEKHEQERGAKIEALKASGYKLFWIACGKDDFLYQSVVTLRNTLDIHNFKYTYRESTGGHTWANWRIYLSEFAPMLFK